MIDELDENLRKAQSEWKAPDTNSGKELPQVNLTAGDLAQGVESGLVSTQTTSQEAPTKNPGLTKEQKLQLASLAVRHQKQNSQDTNTDLLLHQIPKNVGRLFDAHGVAKISVTRQLDDLIALLEKGVDPNREFHTAPLEATDADVHRSDVAGGRANHSGSFIVLAEPRKGIIRSGIKYVLVNDAYSDGINILRQAYPSVEFMTAEEAPKRLAEIVEQEKI